MGHRGAAVTSSRSLDEAGARGLAVEFQTPRKEAAMKRRIIDTVQHYLNPLHVFCRLADLGLDMATAHSLSRWYERHIYRFGAAASARVLRHR